MLKFKSDIYSCQNNWLFFLYYNSYVFLTFNVEQIKAVSTLQETEICVKPILCNFVKELCINKLPIYTNYYRIHLHTELTFKLIYCVLNTLNTSLHTFRSTLYNLFMTSDYLLQILKTSSFLHIYVKDGEFRKEWCFWNMIKICPQFLLFRNIT